jgi:glycosyltransferase involved in cell wall biosynthesis
VRSYWAGDSVATRGMAMAWARLLPRLAARDVPAGLDVIHYPVTVPIPQTAAPCVVTVYDLQHHDLPEFFSRAERSYRRWAYDGPARSATVVVTTSDYTRQRLAQRLGVPADRVEVVYPGIDHRRFAPAGDDDERLLAGLDLPERFVLYPANLWPHKNHDRLVDALAASSDPELRLVLTGQTWGRLPPLLERARLKRVSHRVHHLGYVDADALPALYRAARAVVFPSLYEGFGSPPLEAMACGCAVAASKRGSLGEVCGEAALELDPGSVDSIATAVDRIVADDELRRRLRAAGLERATHFSWREAARRHTDIYVRAVD